jgi:hypothetical protein
MHDHDLDDFVAFINEEIIAIASFPMKSARPLAPSYRTKPILKRKRISIGTAKMISGKPGSRHQIISVHSNKPVCMRAGTAVTGHS